MLCVRAKHKVALDCRMRNRKKEKRGVRMKAVKASGIRTRSIPLPEVGLPARLPFRTRGRERRDKQRAPHSFLGSIHNPAIFISPSATGSLSRTEKEGAAQRSSSEERLSLVTMGDGEKKEAEIIIIVAQTQLLTTRYKRKKKKTSLPAFFSHLALADDPRALAKPNGRIVLSFQLTRVVVR